MGKKVVRVIIMVDDDIKEGRGNPNSLLYAFQEAGMIEIHSVLDNGVQKTVFDILPPAGMSDEGSAVIADDLAKWLERRKDG